MKYYKIKSYRKLIKLIFTLKKMNPVEVSEMFSPENGEQTQKMINQCIERKPIKDIKDKDYKKDKAHKHLSEKWEDLVPAKLGPLTKWEDFKFIFFGIPPKNKKKLN